jgi:plastocyanin
MMRTLFILLIVAGLTGAVARAGTITGHVHAEGKAGADQAAAAGKYDSHAFKTAERVDYADMRDFVVFIVGPLTNANITSPTNLAQVTTTRVSQQKATFSPHVLPVMAGTTVEFPNKDDIYHNVFSYSEAKQFDLGLYKDPVVKNETFDKPGQVDVFCSIHANMSCIVLVLENPFFAVSNARGEYSITNVPAGTYQLKAWHERLPAQIHPITVPESGVIKADFTLGITGLPKN